MISTVAVGTDGSDTASAALAAAFELAERFAASLVVLTAYTAQPRPSSAMRLPTAAAVDAGWAANAAEQAERILTDAEESAAARGIGCTSAMAEGEPAEVLVSLAERHRADVLVVGNKGMHRRLLGSVPNSVTHKASCSVYIVKTT